MSIIALKEVNKSYGGFDVLKNVSFDINENEKVALIGRNGTGKTTIFNIIADKMDFDSGSVYVEKGLNIGYLRQIYGDFPGMTAKSVIEKAFTSVKEVEKKMNVLRLRMEKEPDDIQNIREYSELNEKFEFMGGYNLSEKFNKVTKGLKIPDDVINNHFINLSGGEKTLVMLAEVLLMNPDILLLDEPTNHLDMDACDWLEKYIKEYKGAILYISHDRYFIDKTAMKVLSLENKEVQSYAGNYSAYLVQKTEADERNLKLYERQEREIGRLRATALKFRNYGTEIAIKRAQNLEKRMERMDIYDRPGTEKELQLNFSEEDKVSKEIFYVKNIEKSFSDKLLLHDISFIMRSGDRVAVVGPNGAGKTTLIKIITGQEEADKGIVKRPKSVKYAYLEQHVSFPDPEATLLEQVCGQLDTTVQSARNLLGKFLFSADDVFKKVKELSGGERSRLRLLLEMQSDVNLLILDEPTNHLDIPAREDIEEAISMFAGSMIFVSHDRHFLNKFAERIFELRDGVFNIYEGNYDYYLKKKELEQQQEKNNKAKEAEVKNNDRGKVRRRTDASIRSCEQRISRLEANIEQKNGEILKHSTDYAVLMELLEQKKQLQEQLDNEYDIWMENQD